jgi:hypothetical protein
LISQSRGLGDVYKRQLRQPPPMPTPFLRHRPNKKKKWFSTLDHNKKPHLLDRAVF